jgi:amino-acid N-acetyltransferase
MPVAITPANASLRGSITALLRSAKLPADDLPSSIDNFLVATDEDNVIGAIGFEQYDNCGLLRSLVVSPDYRNAGIAGQLVQNLEANAAASGINCMYLLTETVPDYFVKKGYARISRAEVPASLQQSSEFSYVCPQSAVVMKKDL